MIKPTLWDGNNLKGLWEISIKIDGIRCLKSKTEALSRSNKPLYNIPTELNPGDYEVFDTNWETTVSRVRTLDSTIVELDNFYSLEPLDPRLYLSAVGNPTAEFIKKSMEIVINQGHEGLVLRQGDTWLKVKPVETYDVKILDMTIGNGRNSSRLGAFVTEKGRVGSGLTDAQRELYWDKSLIGQYIEVSCMSLTKNGKFRHPRFQKLRWDK